MGLEVLLYGAKLADHICGSILFIVALETEISAHSWFDFCDHGERLARSARNRRIPDQPHSESIHMFETCTARPLFSNETGQRCVG